MPVGGVREKVLAAHRAGLKTIILPERNLKDLVDVPKKVRDDLKIVPVTHMEQVLEVLHCILSKETPKRFMHLLQRVKPHNEEDAEEG